MTRESSDKAWFGDVLSNFLVLSQRVLGRLGAPRWIPITLVIAAFYVLSVIIFLVVSLPSGRISLEIFAGLTVFFGLLSIGAARDTLRREKSIGEEFIEAAEELADFLGLPARAGEVRFFVAEHDAQHRPSEGVAYNVKSLARADVEGVIHLAHWVASRNLAERNFAFKPDRMLISATDAGKFQRGTLIYVGGPLTHPQISAFIAGDPHVWYQDVPERGDGSNAVVCRNAELGSFATVPPRDDKPIEESMERDTFGCIMRRHESDERCVFAVWGLDARGTLGAAMWLTSSWRRFDDRYHILDDEDFTAVIRVMAGGERADDPLRIDNAEPPLLLPGPAAEDRPGT